MVDKSAKKGGIKVISTVSTYIVWFYVWMVPVKISQFKINLLVCYLKIHVFKFKNTIQAIIDYGVYEEKLLYEPIRSGYAWSTVNPTSGTYSVHWIFDLHKWLYVSLLCLTMINH